MTSESLAGSGAEIVIAPTFQHRLPPLHAGGLEALEALIVEAGRARDALIVWEETKILIDGHNRYAICQRLGLPFSIEWMSFASEAEALAYVDLQQFARRNQESNWIDYQRGKRYRVEKKAIPNPMGLGGKSGKVVKDHDTAKDDLKQSTAETIAKSTGVSQATVKRDAKFADAVDALAESGADKLRVMGESKATVIKAAAMPEPKRKAIAEVMAEAPKLTLKKAITEVRKEEEAGAATMAHLALADGESTPNEPPADEPPRVEIGGHLLLFGDNNDPAIRAQLPAQVALAFCDPPYNSTDEEWDGDHEWSQDWLIEIADIVAVTPGISAIQEFMSRTAMPYRWSTATWITNGMTRGALGFGNWMYTALFSSLKILGRNRQDFEKIAIRASDKHDGHELGAKRQKPPEYLAWLFGLLTNEGDTILDPFVGSGTSVIVAHRLGRRCVAVEKDHATYQAMVRRVRMAVGAAEVAA